MRAILLPLGLTLVGLVIGIPSYITKKRQWPGMIAGFDPAKCTDVDGLTRWVGSAGTILGGAPFGDCEGRVIFLRSPPEPPADPDRLG